MRNAILAATALAAVVFAAPAADAAVILTFGQIGNGTPISATTNVGLTQTTITASNAAVNITGIENGAPTNAFFNMNAVSTNAATPLGGGATQNYAGTFSITSGLGGSGTNYLAGNFTDIVLGVGQAGVLAVGAPPDTLTLSSDVVTSLSTPSAIALGFANLTPDLHIDGTTIGAFTSSVSGTFSANVPEPFTLGLLGVGLLGLGIARRQGSRSA